jgi:hypothetical protein
VTTTNPLDAGVFAVHADRALWNAGTSTDSPYMLQQYSDVSTCQTYSGGSPYVYYQWTATSTSTVDIILFSYNDTVTDNSWVATLYNSSQLAFLGTGNITVPVDGCATSNWVAAVREETSFTKVNQNNYAAGIFVGFNQVQGQNYTVVLSGYNTNDNNIYGVFIRPSLQGFLGSSQTYNRPDFGSVEEGNTCNPGSNVYYWTIHIFTAQFNTYVVDNGNSLSSLDTAACLYFGNNDANPPAACNANWLQCVDTGDIGPLHQLGTIPGQNYTIIQTTYSSSAGSGNPDYILYIYTGTQLGPLPIVTTGIDFTTGAITSGAVTSGAMTTDLVTTASLTTAGTGEEESSSPASKLQLIASFIAFILLASI